MPARFGRIVHQQAQVSSFETFTVILKVISRLINSARYDRFQLLSLINKKR